MRKTVVIHNPRPIALKGKKTMTKKKPAKRKAPAKKKRRNPAPAATVANPRKRKRTRKNPSTTMTRYNGGKVVHHRRRTKRRNPSGMPWGDILTAAGVGLAVPVVGSVAAAQLAQMEPTRTKLYMRIAGALAAIAGGYLLTQRKHQAVGVALIGGGAATAFQNDLSVALFKLINRNQAPGTGPVAGQQQAAIQGLVEEEMGALQEMGALAEIGALSEPDLAQYAARLERMQALAPRY